MFFPSDKKISKTFLFDSNCEFIYSIFIVMSCQIIRFFPRSIYYNCCNLRLNCLHFISTRDFKHSNMYFNIFRIFFLEKSIKKIIV